MEFEITDACNLNCKYCYAKPPANVVPSTKDIKYLLSKTKDGADPFGMALVGGEPFIREDILDVLRFASTLFREVGVSTNGTLLYKMALKDMRALKNIVEEQHLSIQVSIDSTNPVINDLTRGMGVQALEGIERLNKNRIMFSVGIVATKRNVEDVHSTIDKLLSYECLVGINYESLQPSRQLGRDKYVRLALSDGEMKTSREEVIQHIKVVRKEIKVSGVDEECSKFDRTSLLSEYNLKPCTAGFLRSGVVANGDVVPCLVIRDVKLGSLYNESWKEIWEKALKRFLHLNVEGGQCASVNLLRKEAMVRGKISNK